MTHPSFLVLTAFLLKLCHLSTLPDIHLDPMCSSKLADPSPRRQIISVGNKLSKSSMPLSAYFYLEFGRIKRTAFFLFTVQRWEGRSLKLLPCPCLQGESCLWETQIHLQDVWSWQHPIVFHDSPCHLLLHMTKILPSLCKLEMRFWYYAMRRKS